VVIDVRERIHRIVIGSVHVMLVADDVRENLGIFSEDLVGGMSSFIYSMNFSMLPWHRCH
jgi:hypothetical protein